MQAEEYLNKILLESLDETASGSDDFAQFKAAAHAAHEPFNTHGKNYNPNPRMGFIYHGTDRNDVKSICQTGTSGSKEYYGKAIGQLYGRGLYAMIRPEDVSVGNCIVEFAVKPGAFDNFIIFQYSYRSLLFKKGLISRENESLGENIARLLDKESLEMFRRAGVDLNRISHSTFMSYMTQGESRGGERGYGDETRLDRTKVDGFTIDYSGPAVVVRRMDILVPNRWRARGDHEWHYCIENAEQFDKLNLYFDAFARVRGDYPNTKFNQKPSAGFIFIGDQNKGNLINLRTGEAVSPIPLKNCTSFSNVKEYGYNTATFTLGKTSYTLRTADDGKTVQVLYKPKGWNEFLEMEGGLKTFKQLAERGIDASIFARIMNLYPSTNLNQSTEAGMLMIGDEIRGNFIDLNSGELFSPVPLKNCTFFQRGNGGYVAYFSLGKNKFMLQTKGGLANCSVFYESAQAGGMKEMDGGYTGFVKLINGLMAKAKKPVNESFMQGSFDDFVNKEIPNTTTLYSRANNMGQFADDVKSGKNIYFYTCSKPENAKSMMQNGMTYEFTGTSNDTTTFQGVVAYGSFSLAGAERNMNIGYGNAIYKFVLKDDLSKYIIFDPKIRAALGFGNEKLSDQVKRMCKGKTYNGRPLIDVLDYGLKHPIKYYGQNPHLKSEGIYGLDHLSSSTQGDACAAFFAALRGEQKGRLNGATMYDEMPVHLMGIHGYIYNGGNHWDCICVRNYNALMPVAYVVSRGYGSSGLPRDSKGHIIWQKNEYMNQEWFDRMNDNVTARFQYAGEYPDTPMNTKQLHGYTLVNGPQGYNFKDVKSHRHLLPIDVPHAASFTIQNGVPYTSFEFANSAWDIYIKDGVPTLVRNGQVIPGEKFVQLLKIMMQKGVLPKDTKIHGDALIGGQPQEVLAEGKNVTKNKGVRGGIDNLKAQQGRLEMNQESFFIKPEVVQIFNKIAGLLMSEDKKTINNAKEQLLRLFEDDNIASKVFKDEEARQFAAYCVYGQKSPLRFDPNTNKYYAITSKMVSPGHVQTGKDAANNAVVANTVIKTVRDEKAVKSLDIKDEEGMEKVANLCKKYKGFYLKGNIIYMCVIRGKAFTETGRQAWMEIRKSLKNLGFVTTQPMLTKIKTSSGQVVTCAYTNISKPDNNN